MKCMEADAKCFECETSTCSPAAVNPAGLHHSLQEAAWWVPVQFWKPLASSTPLECVLFNTQPPLKLPKYVLSSIFLTTLTKSNTFLLSFWGLIMSVALICLWHIALRVPAWDCHQLKPSFNTIYKPLWSPPGGTYQDLLWKSPWARIWGNRHYLVTSLAFLLYNAIEMLYRILKNFGEGRLHVMNSISGE